jgi:hypothetical protein
VQLLFDLLSSCSGSNSTPATTTPPVPSRR